jgi:hypothetical protein
MTQRGAVFGIAGSGGEHHLGLQAFLFRLGQVAAIDAGQRPPGAFQQAQHAPPHRARLLLPQFACVVAGRLEPLRQPPSADKGGEGLVECHIPGHPDDSVRQLVKKQLRQIGFGPRDERTHQRVSEPTQGRIRRNRRHIGFKARPFELGGLPARGVLVEIAPIRCAPDQRIAPAARPQRQRRCGEDVPGDRGTTEIDVGAIAIAHRQFELLLGKHQHTLRELEALVQQRRFRIVLATRFELCHHAAHRLPAAQHAQLTGGGLGVISEGLTAAVEEYEEQNPERGESGPEKSEKSRMHAHYGM